MKGPRVLVKGNETVLLSMEATLSWMLDADYRSEVINEQGLQETANRTGKPVKIISSAEEVLHVVEPAERAELLEVA
jgi:hypothetical protein